MKKLTALIVFLLVVSIVCGSVAYAADEEYRYTYYPRCSSWHVSLLDAFKEVGGPTAFSEWRRIAELNGITGYVGSYDQNVFLLAKLQSGTLFKSVERVVVSVSPAQGMSYTPASSFDPVGQLHELALRSWVRPVKVSIPQVSGTDLAFGTLRSNGTRLHAGIDWIAAEGTPVYAMASGIVVEYDPDFYCGTAAVAIRHFDGGYVSRYCEIASNLRVGDYVYQGQQIGSVARSSTGSAMLHLECFLGTAYGSLTDLNNSYYAYVPYGVYRRRADLVDPTFLLQLPIG